MRVAELAGRYPSSFSLAASTIRIIATREPQKLNVDRIAQIVKSDPSMVAELRNAATYQPSHRCLRTVEVLRRFGTIPKPGRGHLALDLVERTSGRSQVKDSSGRSGVGRGGRRFY